MCFGESPHDGGSFLLHLCRPPNSNQTQSVNPIVNQPVNQSIRRSIHLSFDLKDKDRSIRSKSVLGRFLHVRLDGALLGLALIVHLLIMALTLTIARQTRGSFTETTLHSVGYSSSHIISNGPHIHVEELATTPSCSSSSSSLQRDEKRGVFHNMKSSG